MKSKSMVPRSGKMLIWISKDTHKLLEIDAAKHGGTIGDLVDVAITSYYRSIAREKMEENK